MGISIVAAAAVFFVVAGTLLYLIIIYNGLVRLRNDGNRAWANIDVLLKQLVQAVPLTQRRNQRVRTDGLSANFHAAHGSRPPGPWSGECQG